MQKTIWVETGGFQTFAAMASQLLSNVESCLLESWDWAFCRAASEVLSESNVIEVAAILAIT